MFHPIVRLFVEVDEAVYREGESDQDILCSFKAAPVRVGVHRTPEPPHRPCSVVRLRVSMMRKPLWDAGDPAAEDNWHHVLMPVLEEALSKVQLDLVHCSKPLAHRSTDLHELDIPRFELQIDPYVLSFENPGSFRIPDEVVALTSRFRELLNAGLLGDGEPVRVDIPFVDEEKLWDAYNAMADETSSASVDGEGERCAQEGCAQTGDDRLGDSGDGACTDETVEEKASGEGLDACAGVEGDAEDDTEGDVEDDEGESCIDYSCWGVMMKDGSYVIVDTCCDRDAALGMCEG